MNGCGAIVMHGTPMRLITWNLRGGAGRPLWPHLQAELQADIGFLQESDAAPDGANVL